MAEELAKGLYEWFRLGYLTGDTGGASLNIYFRRVLSSSDQADKSPTIAPPIEYDDSKFNLVIGLFDHKLVNCPRWRKAITDLSEQLHIAEKKLAQRSKPLQKSSSTRTIFLPVALEDAFYSLAPIYRHFNPVRLVELQLDAALAALRRAALETVSRALHSIDPTTYPELRVFLSHAKKDGKRIAEELRDGIRRFGQLLPWYDANDLPLGKEWDDPLNDAMNRTTDGMIAVVTDAYPTRPWCRIELQRARTPKREEEDDETPGNVWRIQPVIAILNPEKTWTRGLATLEGVPRIGWNAAEAASVIESTVDRFVLEMMLSQVRLRTCQALSRTHKHDAESTCFLTWVPDTWTLGALRSEMKRAKQDPGDIRRIVYPGQGLSPAELKDLRIQVEAFHSETTLLSFDEYLTQPHEPSHA
jgi:hypothetical protein